jgi:hypothetical protein
MATSNHLTQNEHFMLVGYKYIDWYWWNCWPLLLKLSFHNYIFFFQPYCVEYI